MNDVSKNKKMQVEVLDVPKITNTARLNEEARREKIVAPKEVRRQLSKTAGLNRGLIMKVLIYVIIITAVALLRSFIAYDISDLGRVKSQKEKELSELKKEVSQMDNEFTSKNDSKLIEQEFKDKGYVSNDSVEYINLNK